MGKPSSVWVNVQNHGPHRFKPGHRLSVCGRVVRAQNSEQLSKAPAEGCAACGGKQPVIEQQPQQPSTGTSESGNTDESGQ